MLVWVGEIWRWGQSQNYFNLVKFYINKSLLSSPVLNSVKTYRRKPQGNENILDIYVSQIIN